MRNLFQKIGGKKMKTSEYVKTIVVYGKMVNVGMDDAGQQYFIEYVNANGELVAVHIISIMKKLQNMLQTQIVTLEKFGAMKNGKEYKKKKKKE